MKFIFYSAFHFEKWDYTNPLEQGIGGSETAHIECALRLAKRGHEVISYSPIKESIDTCFGGVSWKDSKDVDFRQDGIWIISREPQVIDQFNDNINQRKILIMQDTAYHRMTPERAEKFDYLLPLCNSHTAFTTKRYPTVESKIIQSSNGIRVDMIEEIEKERITRNPHKLIFASSPDRGLVALLKIFRKAKEYISDLELHVFYGFNNIDTMIGDDWDLPLGDEKVTKRQIIELAKQKGVFLRGRMNQKDLYREWFSSGLWVHPSAIFAETSCITSMDAQACGAIPITAPVWAIADNVKYGYFIQGQPLTDPIIQLYYVDKIKEVLLERNLEEIEEMRKKMMMYSRERFNWENICDQYESLVTE